MSQDTLHFITTVVLITVSGALAPGPLFFGTLSHGIHVGARSGLIFSVAHTIIEFSLVMLLTSGLASVVNELTVKLVIGIAGGLVLLVFGIFQVRSALRSEKAETKPERVSSRNLLVIGLAFTGLNPYFILWWLTIGANLILQSIELFASLVGVIFMYVCHVWVDYAWLTLISHFAKKGIDVLGFQWYKGIMIVFGGLLMYFGFTFLINSITAFL